MFLHKARNYSGTLGKSALHSFRGQYPTSCSLDIPVSLRGRRLLPHILCFATAEPSRVPPAALLKGQGNRLEIEKVNFWPNRLIGDAGMPPGERRTRTNIAKFDAAAKDPHYTTLLPSGLLGPVRVLGVLPG